MSVPNPSSWIQRKTRLRELLLHDHNQSHYHQSSDVDADHNKADVDEHDNSDEDQMGLALDRLLHGQQAILASNYQVLRPTQRLLEINQLRFQDMDLDLLGRLDEGQFGVVEVVRCKLERSDGNSKVYVRKRIEKRFALRTREQNSPQLERDILLAALRASTPWAPHLLCAYHSSESRRGMGYLNLVMEYAEGGTLWDLLESSSLRGQGVLGDGAGGRISEIDLKWWIPQIVCAIGWLHELGYVHRDIKPHNFVIRLSSSPRIQLIDFGSAAPLLPPSKGGGRLVPKRYCLVPVGTCDYISPEILKAHEMALLALELEQSDSEDSRTKSGLTPLIRNEDEVYGAETDWWSLGAMIYEMAYGIAPFWARDVRRTYERIMNHRNSLKFPSQSEPDAMQPSLSLEFEDFVKRLLTDAEFRLGRHHLLEITGHKWFVSAGVDWDSLSSTSHESNLPLPPPPNLHLPQFSYTYPVPSDPAFPPQGHTDMNDMNATANTANVEEEEQFSQPFAFSALFQSSPGVSQYNSRHGSRSQYDSHSNSDFRGENQSSPGLSILHDTSRIRKQNGGDSGNEGNESMSTAAAFIGFSWGPLKDAFIHGPESVVEDRAGGYHMAMEEDPPNLISQKCVADMENTPRPRSQGAGQGQGRRIPSSWLTPVPTPNPGPRSLGAPSSAHGFAFSTPIRPYQTLPRGMGSAVRPAMSTPYRTPYNAGTYTGGGTPHMGTLRRPLSDREAMKQLVDCVGASARKRVLESGRKVRVLNAYSSFGNGTSSLGKGNGRGGIRSGGTGSSGRSVRFEYPEASFKLKSGSGLESNLSHTSSRSRSRSGGNGNISGGSGIGKFFGRSSLTSSRSSARSYTTSGASETDANDRTEGETRTNTDVDIDMEYSYSGTETETDSYTEEGTETESEAPPSPSPSPRPGSAMSILSTRSISMTMTMMSNGNRKDREMRNGTPTATLTSTLSQKEGTMTNIKTSRVGYTDVHGRNRSSSNGSLTRMPSEAPMGSSGIGAVGERRKVITPATTNTATVKNMFPSTTFEDGIGFEETLDELEVKHVSIMEDICDLERRLERVRGHQT